MDLIKPAKKAAKHAKVKLILDKSHNQTTRAPYKEQWNSIGNHITYGYDDAGSVTYFSRSNISPTSSSSERTPLCNFVIHRNGDIRLIANYACYHMGVGGPLKAGQVSASSAFKAQPQSNTLPKRHRKKPQATKTLVPKDKGNLHMIGIEVISLKPDTRGITQSNKTDGMTKAQRNSLRWLNAALLRELKRQKRIPAGLHPVHYSFNHRDYAPGRKPDTFIPTKTLRKWIKRNLAWGNVRSPRL